MNGDCGMFLIKYVEYLMHDHPFNSLTGVRIDWFREKWQLNTSTSKIYPCSGFHFDYVIGLYIVEC